MPSARAPLVLCLIRRDRPGGNYEARLRFAPQTQMSFASASYGSSKAR